MKKHVKIAIAVLLVVLSAAAAATVLLRPVTVLTETVAMGPLVESFTERGNATPQQSVTVSSNLSGRVEELLFKVGRQVQAGELLMRIDEQDARNALTEQLDSLALQQQSLSLSGTAQTQELAVSKEQLNAQLLQAQRQYDALFGPEGTAALQLESAQSQADLARRSYDYTAKLYEQQLASQMELLQAEQELQAAEAALAATVSECSSENKAYYEELIRSSQAQLAATERSGSTLGASTGTQTQQLQLQIDSLRDRLADRPVAAPISGVVGQLLVAEGQYIAERQPVAVLYGDGALQIEVSLLEEDAISLQVGELVSCRLVDNSLFEAEVIFVSPIVEERLSTVGMVESRRSVELRPLSAPSGLCAGSQVELTFSSVVVDSTLSVPTGALVPHGQGSAVYVLREGKLQLVEVQTGQRSSGRIAVTAGLQEGDQVVRDPYQDGVKQGARARS